MCPPPRVVPGLEGPRVTHWSAARPLPEGWSLGRLETEISFPDQVPFPGRGVCFLVPPTLHPPAGTRKGLCAHRFTCLHCPGHQCFWAGLPASRRLTPGRGRCGGRRLVSQTPPAWQLLISWGLELKIEALLWSGPAWAHRDLVCRRFGSVSGVLAGTEDCGEGRPGATSHVSIWWPRHVQPELSWPPS